MQFWDEHLSYMRQTGSTALVGNSLPHIQFKGYVHLCNQFIYCFNASEKQKLCKSSSIKFNKNKNKIFNVRKILNRWKCIGIQWLLSPIVSHIKKVYTMQYPFFAWYLWIAYQRIPPDGGQKDTFCLRWVNGVLCIHLTYTLGTFPTDILHIHCKHPKTSIMNLKGNQQQKKLVQSCTKLLRGLLQSGH